MQRKEGVIPVIQIKIVSILVLITIVIMLFVNQFNKQTCHFFKLLTFGNSQHLLALPSNNFSSYHTTCNIYEKYICPVTASFFTEGKLYYLYILKVSCTLTELLFGFIFSSSFCSPCCQEKKATCCKSLEKENHKGKKKKEKESCSAAGN